MVSTKASIVVSNTTPVISLAGLGLLHLLESLYQSVTIPEQVHAEYNAGKEAGDPSIDGLAWLQIEPVASFAPALPNALGQGEKAAITLAIIHPTRLLLLDDRYARRIAAQHGLPVSGTLGVLLAAKNRGLVTQIRPLLDEMIRQRRRLSPRLYARMVAAAGEAAP